MTESYDEQAKRIWLPNISVKQTEKFYSLKSYSGYTLRFADPEADEYRLQPDVSNEIIGQTVLKCLNQSRHLSYEHACLLEEGLSDRYQTWVQDMMTTYGYKGKRALFKNMQNCGVSLKDHLITIKPTKHERLEGWSGDGFTEDDYVKIPAHSTPDAIGAALRLAFTRCR